MSEARSNFFPFWGGSKSKYLLNLNLLLSWLKDLLLEGGEGSTFAVVKPENVYIR